MKNYSLIITEKPAVAKRIAKALDSEGNPKSLKENGVPYFFAKRDRNLIIVSALGHLYTVIHERGGRNYYPVFGFKWAPQFLDKRGTKKIRNWIETISKLAGNADAFINACDYDLEGSLIGYCILKYACCNRENEAKRMKFSTLTESELQEAYENPIYQLNFALIEAGRTRHEVDWLYGINLSRAITLAAKRWSRKYSTLSTGRVQGPTLKILCEREKTIRNFVPTPYWEIIAEAQIRNKIYKVEYERRHINKKTEAQAIVEVCKDSLLEVKKIEKRKLRQNPPTPFDIGTLQAEVYRLLGYSPKRTNQIAQHLYIDALISYPRTSSQKLPRRINFRNIITALSQETAYKRHASLLLEKEELIPREGVKVDPAHPAIYPTGNLPKRKLGSQEMKVWNLIVKRFMALFADAAIKQSLKITLDTNSHKFFLMGRQNIREGWMQFYNQYFRIEERELPLLEVGEKSQLKRIAYNQKFTNPPARYNPSSILKKMEKLGIGTKATRADIIETLYNRGYINGERIVVNELGFDVTRILEKAAPGIISVKFTQELERKIEYIKNEKEKRENVLIEAVEQLKPQLEQFKMNERQTGEMLSNAMERVQIQQRIIGNCPSCSKGKLTILYSRKTGKRFVGCTNYFNGTCQTSFPLPQRGYIEPLRKKCGYCGLPMVKVNIKKNRPWNLCFNSECPSKGKRSSRNEMYELQQGSQRPIL